MCVIVYQSVGLLCRLIAVYVSYKTPNYNLVLLQIMVGNEEIPHTAKQPY